MTWALVTDQRDRDGRRLTARGRLGGWLPSVPRGELRAAVEWMVRGCSPSTYASDCQYVVDGFVQGIGEHLTSSRSRHADLWRRAKALLDDHGTTHMNVVNVKAHRTRRQAEDDEEVGVAAVGQWEGNNDADHAAKSLARRLWADRRLVEERGAAQRQTWCRLLKRTAVYTSVAQKRLDALHLPRVTRNRVRVSERQCGDHHVVPHPNGLGTWCDLCHLIANTAISRRVLAGRQCRGDVLLQVHASHRVRLSCGVYWCGRCGAFMSRLPRALKRQCPGAPPNHAARTILRRLRGGPPPTTHAYLNKLTDDQYPTQRALAGSTCSVSPLSSAEKGDVGLRRRRRRPWLLTVVVTVLSMIGV